MFLSEVINERQLHGEHEPTIVMYVGMLHVNENKDHASGREWSIVIVID